MLPENIRNQLYFIATEDRNSKLFGGEYGKAIELAGYSYSPKVGILYDDEGKKVFINNKDKVIPWDNNSTYNFK